MIQNAPKLRAPKVLLRHVARLSVALGLGLGGGSVEIAGAPLRTGLRWIGRKYSIRVMAALMDRFGLRCGEGFRVCSAIGAISSSDGSELCGGMRGTHQLWRNGTPIRQTRCSNQILTPCAGVAKGSVSMFPYSARCINSQAALFARQQQSAQDQKSQGSMTAQEDPFDTLTDKIPERPVSVAEGASYSLVILAGLAVAGAAAYAVFKELLLEPKEYKVFGIALDRVKAESQVSIRLGSPISGYGQESRNRAARQRISNRAWTDEDGVERIEVMFHIRGPQGAGKVFCEMFNDKDERSWKYTYLIVDILSPSPKRLLLESYVPPAVNLSHA